MRGYVGAAVVVALLSVVIHLLAAVVPRVAHREVKAELVWAFIPGAVESGAPFAAWYQVVDRSDTRERPDDMWAQLRICGVSGTCEMSSRQPLTLDQVGLVTASRDLEPGDYTVSFLVLATNNFGVPRAVSSVTHLVRFGRD